MKRIVGYACALMLVAAFAVMASDSTKPAAADTTKAKAEATPAKEKADTTKPAPKGKLVTSPTGLSYVDLKVGQGKAAVNGDKVVVHYTVWLDGGGWTKGKKIQSSHDSNQTFPCSVGQQNLIKGWNEGMLGMMPGSIRELHVPAALAWGAAGMGSMIPANANVIFEIELVSYGK